MRPWLARLGHPLQASLAMLNAFAEERGVRVAGGRPLRFVAPSPGRRDYGDYERRVFDSGEVQTRPGSRHDLFNALAWLAFPRAKAALNARHAEEIPRERGRRGRLRDLLTLLDEGGIVVSCSSESLLGLMREHRWQELFWARRAELAASVRVRVLGHAVLEQALAPWPGITCKVLPVAPGAPHSDAEDAAAAARIQALSGEVSPRSLPVLPVFGLPGWWPGNDVPEFYEDRRYFRPRRDKIAKGAGQAAAMAT